MGAACSTGSVPPAGDNEKPSKSGGQSKSVNPLDALVKAGSDAAKATADAGSSLAEAAKETASDTADRAHAAAQGAAEKAHNAADKASEQAHSAAESAAQAANEKKEEAEKKAHEVSEKAQEAAHDASEKAQHAAHDASEKAQDAAHQASEKAQETAHEAKKTAEKAADDAQKSAQETTEAVSAEAQEAARKAGHEMEKFENQMGGHADAFLKQDGLVLKHTSDREIAFYDGAYQQTESLQHFAPKYHGTVTIDNKKFIRLSDATEGYKHPNILDVKLGVTSIGDDAPPEKADSMRQKDEASTTTKLGYRITGYKVWHGDQLIVADKPETKQIKTEAEAVEHYRKYFSNGSILRKPVVHAFLQEIRKVQAWFQEQDKIKFISSSLLFVYEGEEAADTASPQVRLKMIDFAHVSSLHDGHKDEGYLTGLGSLLEALGGLAD